MVEETVWYSPELIEVAKKSMCLSPSTLHKIMNPYCPICMIERVRAFPKE